MYFEAELKNKKYKIDVLEERNEWVVCLQEEGAEKQVHNIKKEHYKSLDGAISFLFENSSYMIDVVGSGTMYTVYTRGSFRDIPIYNDESLLHESLKGGKALGGSDKITAGMPGKIVDILVKVGDEVKEGTPVLIMEAMKMENEMRSSRSAVVKEIFVKIGDSVESGAKLMTFNPKT